MKKNDTNRRAVLGISGASGSIYALRLAKILLEAGADLYCIPTRAAVKILADETGYADFNTAIAAQLERNPADCGKLRVCGIDDFGAPPASGSWGVVGILKNKKKKKTRNEKHPNKTQNA